MGSSIQQRHMVRESRKIQSSLTTSQPQIHSFCLLGIQPASSPVWVPNVESGQSALPSHLPGPLLLWLGPQKGRLGPMLQFEERVPFTSHQAFSIPAKSMEILGSKISVDPTPPHYSHVGRDLPAAQCVPEAGGVFATPFLQMAVGGERPGEETEGGRASCEDWVSPDHSAPARATDATFWLVHIGTYSFPPHPLLTLTYPWVHTVQSKAIHIHWFSQDYRRGKLCRDLCPLYRWGDRGPEREGTWFPDRCRMLVLGVRPQTPASSHWTSHGSPHPAPHQEGCSIWWAQKRRQIYRAQGPTVGSEVEATNGGGQCLHR